MPLQGHKWLSKSGWGGAREGQVVIWQQWRRAAAAGGAFYFAKRWGGAIALLPPLHLRPCSRLRRSHRNNSKTRHSRPIWIPHSSLVALPLVTRGESKWAFVTRLGIIFFRAFASAYRHQDNVFWLQKNAKKIMMVFWDCLFPKRIEPGSIHGLLWIVISSLV